MVLGETVSYCIYWVKTLWHISPVFIIIIIIIIIVFFRAKFHNFKKNKECVEVRCRLPTPLTALRLYFE